MNQIVEINFVVEAGEWRWEQWDEEREREREITTKTRDQYFTALCWTGGGNCLPEFPPWRKYTQECADTDTQSLVGLGHISGVLYCREPL